MQVMGQRRGRDPDLFLQTTDGQSRIAAWREYFDTAAIAGQMGLSLEALGMSPPDRG